MTLFSRSSMLVVGRPSRGVRWLRWLTVALGIACLSVSGRELQRAWRGSIPAPGQDPISHYQARLTAIRAAIAGQRQVDYATDLPPGPQDYMGQPIHHATLLQYALCPVLLTTDAATVFVLVQQVSPATLADLGVSDDDRVVTVDDLSLTLYRRRR